MTDTTTTEPTDPPDVFHVESVIQPIDGQDVACKKITFGPPGKTRSLMVRDTLSPGKYLDSLETFGGTKTEAGEGLAMLAFRLVELDKHPSGFYSTRKHVLNALDKLGNDGVAAIVKAYAAERVGAEDRGLAAVGF